jgi:hypothetical protein
VVVVVVGGAVVVVLVVVVVVVVGLVVAEARVVEASPLAEPPHAARSRAPKAMVRLDFMRPPREVVRRDDT